MVEKVINLFLQRRHPSMNAARYAGRNEENPVVRVSHRGTSPSVAAGKREGSGVQSHPKRT
jgi:hypothetical protein